MRIRARRFLRAVLNHPVRPGIDKGCLEDPMMGHSRVRAKPGSRAGPFLMASLAPPDRAPAPPHWLNNDMTYSPGLHSILQKAREELLDLSARNRLINTPRDPARGKKLDIVDERSEEVFRLLGPRAEGHVVPAGSR